MAPSVSACHVHEDLRSSIPVKSQGGGWCTGHASTGQEERDPWGVLSWDAEGLGYTLTEQSSNICADNLRM